MSPKNSKVAGDLLFWFQLCMTWAFSLPQIIRSLHNTVGMSVTWSLFSVTFIALNLSLAFSAYKQSPGRKAGQVVCVYINWFIPWVTMLVIISLKGVWTKQDNLLTITILVCIAIVLIAGWKGSLTRTLSKPITKGIISLIVKSVPQLYIGYCIIAAGKNDGLAGMTIIIGHITICARLIEISFAARYHGWNPSNVGLLISETGNEITWLTTTSVWLYYQ